MSDYKSLMSNLLRSCPNIYPEPVDATVAMLGPRSGFQWNAQGELQGDGAGGNGQMDYDELNETETEARTKLAQHDFLRSHYATTLLETQAERMRRQFLEQNMDMVLDGSPVATYFRNEYHLSPSARELVTGKAHSYADSPFLYFPDNITPEWGEVVHRFHDWVEERMARELGVSISGENNHWPEEAKVLAEKISIARARLHPLMHNGQDYQEYLEQGRQLCGRLIDEIIAEEAAQQISPPTPHRRRSRAP